MYASSSIEEVTECPVCHKTIVVAPETTSATEIRWFCTKCHTWLEHRFGTNSRMALYAASNVR